MLNINEVRRIVVKVGTSTLTYENGKLNIRRIRRLVHHHQRPRTGGLKWCLCRPARSASAPPSSA